MVELGRDWKTLRALRWVRLLTKPGARVRVKPGDRLALVFDQPGSEVSVKVALSCAGGEPTANESQLVKNYGAGKG